MSEAVNVIVDSDGILKCEEGNDVRILFEENKENKKEDRNAKYWEAMYKLDEEAGSSGEDFVDVMPRVRGRPASQQQLENRSSKLKGVTYNRAIPDNDVFYEECQTLFNYLETGQNPYPNGSNSRRELPRKAKKYYLQNKSMFKMHRKGGRRKLCLLLI